MGVLYPRPLQRDHEPILSWSLDRRKRYCREWLDRGRDEHTFSIRTLSSNPQPCHSEPCSDCRADSVCYPSHTSINSRHSKRPPESSQICKDAAILASSNLDAEG